MPLVYLTVIAALAPAATRTAAQDTGARATATEADRLYLHRDDPANAGRAAAIWADELRADPQDYGAAWKLARIRYWIGDHAAGAERERQFQQGLDAARRAVAIRANGPEGHFWLASNMGGLAESGGIVSGLKYRGAIRDEFERVTQIDPPFDGGAAWTALGGWYLEVPALLGGNKTTAERLLRKALTYDPNSTVTHYFLARTLLATGRKAEARQELQRALDAATDPEDAPEDREWKAKARDLLARTARQPTPGQSSERRSGAAAEGNNR